MSEAYEDQLSRVEQLQHSGSLTPNLVTLLHEAATEIERLRELVRISDDEASGQAARADHLSNELAELRLACLWQPSKEERDGTHGSGDTRNAG